MLMQIMFVVLCKNKLPIQQMFKILKSNFWEMKNVHDCFIPRLLKILMKLKNISWIDKMFMNGKISENLKIVCDLQNSLSIHKMFADS